MALAGRTGVVGPGLIGSIPKLCWIEWHRPVLVRSMQGGPCSTAKLRWDACHVGLQVIDKKLDGGVCRDTNNTWKGLVGEPTKNRFSSFAGCSHGNLDVRTV
jgi:hypothetical protein